MSAPTTFWVATTFVSRSPHILAHGLPLAERPTVEPWRYLPYSAEEVAQQKYGDYDFALRRFEHQRLQAQA